MAPKEFKRYQMVLDLQRIEIPTVRLPKGYHWIPWRSFLNERHAQVKWRAFRDDLDGQVFDCLRDVDGCRRLISEITRQPTFCGEATWLLAFQQDPEWPSRDCGTIQGIERSGGFGAIQNVGIIPEHRGRKLGRALVCKALQGFQESGLPFASLEVTALNSVAVNLYRSLGFLVTQVLFRDAARGRIIDGSQRPPEPSEQEMPAR